MDYEREILLGIFVVFLSALVGAEVAHRLRMPAVVGQIAAGAAIGPSALGWATPGQPLEVLAGIGAVLLLFSVGLETQLGELRRVGPIALRVGVFGVAAPFLLGGAWAMALGFPIARAAFVASAFVATSVGITASVLQEKGVLDRTESRVILGAAILDDMLAMLLLGVVAALQTSAGVDAAKLLFVLLQALAFVAVVAILGTRVMRRSPEILDAPADPESPLSLSMAICLGLAVAAAYTGLAAIIGAFLAGMILAETEHREALARDTRALMTLLVPFFFVVTGTKVEVGLLGDPSVLGAVLLVTLLAALGKLVGCGLPARTLGRRSALIVGVGMIPRGEVGILVASLGRQAGVFTPTIYAIVIAMSILTSVLAPPLLSLLLRPPAIAPAPEGPTVATGREELL